MNCPALGFAIGNMIYGAFLGSVAGFEVGPVAACAIQGTVAGYTALRQINATRRGQDFAAPFRIQAYANFLTVAGLLYTGLTNPAALNMVILPIITFSLWGKGHWDVANSLNKNVDDPAARKLQRRYLIEYGVAETIAPLKQMQADRVVGTFGALFTNPGALTQVQIFSLLPLPIFIGGLCQAVRNKSPNPVARRAHQSILPNNLYAAAYATGAVLTVSSGNFLFAAAQACWAFGYHRLSGGGNQPPTDQVDACGCTLV